MSHEKRFEFGTFCETHATQADESFKTSCDGQPEKYKYCFQIQISRTSGETFSDDMQLTINRKHQSSKKFDQPIHFSFTSAAVHGIINSHASPKAAAPGIPSPTTLFGSLFALSGSSSGLSAVARISRAFIAKGGKQSSPGIFPTAVQQPYDLCRAIDRALLFRMIATTILFFSLLLRYCRRLLF